MSDGDKPRQAACGCKPWDAYDLHSSECKFADLKAEIERLRAEVDRYERARIAFKERIENELEPGLKAAQERADKYFAEGHELMQKLGKAQERLAAIERPDYDVMLERELDKLQERLADLEQQKVFEAAWAEKLKEFGTIDRLIEEYSRYKMRARNSEERRAKAEGLLRRIIPVGLTGFNKEIDDYLAEQEKSLPAGPFPEMPHQPTDKPEPDKG